MADEHGYEDSEVFLHQLSESILGKGTSITSQDSVGDGTLLTESWFDPEELEWREKAICRGTDPNVFFPPRGGSMLPAFVICHGCPVRLKCLESALDKGDNLGIRAGHTPYERKKIQAEIQEGKTLEKASATFMNKREVKLRKARIRQKMVDSV